ncbi:MAG: AbrB/MazE/SpoVT family DNA-binding domain-containing protein [Clostridia bacterium]|nr:AbrB/MazE/SpoVT family DNA-binding domain-containing protein [Clostridia bacterium]
MKATGIVRRIDDLGRVVIPKEIRRTMRIREGDPLEIYTDREGEVIFKKYSPIGELSAFAGQYADTLHRICNMAVVICDRDGVIACSGLGKKEYSDRKMSEQMETLLERRSLYTYGADGKKIPVVADGNHYISCAMPILAEGDLIGSVCSVAAMDETLGKKPDDTGITPVQTAGGLLGRKMAN